MLRYVSVPGGLQRCYERLWEVWWHWRHGCQNDALYRRTAGHLVLNVGSYYGIIDGTGLLMNKALEL